MARVKIRLFAIYRELAGVREVELEVPDNTTILALARLLEEKFPKLKGYFTKNDRINDEATILVNGRNIEWLDREKTILGDGDTVAFIPPAGGGQLNYHVY